MVIGENLAQDNECIHWLPVSAVHNDYEMNTVVILDERWAVSARRKGADDQRGGAGAGALKAGATLGQPPDWYRRGDRQRGDWSRAATSDAGGHGDWTQPGGAAFAGRKLPALCLR